jgi:glycogen debranching enzyme
MSPGAPLDVERVRRSAREVLESHWREPGFTCPNAATYPWLWLWDSCFHAMVWAELGEPDRARSELAVALGGQHRSGFVPHVRYLDHSRVHDAFWWPEPPAATVATSSITQPPIHAMAVAELVRRGVDVPDELVERSTAGLWFLLHRRRRSAAGLIELVHPWESGCDHSPRWDDLMSLGLDVAGVDRYDEQHWFDRKGELVASVHRDADGAPLWNDGFAVGSVAFSAMTAHGARELAELTGDGVLADAANDLTAALATRWDPERRTFVDDGPTAHGSGRIRTAEALLPALVVHDAEVVAAVASELTDPTALGGAYGPAQVHRDEPTHRAGSYWRGPSWPQLDLLLSVALSTSGVPAGVAAAREVAHSSAAGAVRSGWAEYWDPDDATPGGAAPQSWSTLAVLLLAA